MAKGKKVTRRGKARAKQQRAAEQQGKRRGAVKQKQLEVEKVREVAQASRKGMQGAEGARRSYSHSFKYNTRIRERALQDPVAHNFSYSFDDIILKSRPITQIDGSLLYRHEGHLNGKHGFFEIALNPHNETIFHRVFVRSKGFK